MKIKQIEINSFRGIPNNLTIKFPLRDNKPISLIIIGDNGVGKSSIVDAIEFCLQGHISQSKQTLPTIKSFYSKKLPNISILLENNEKINRQLFEDEQGLLLNVRQPHKLFSISPFVLRRHDILRFINSSEAERTLVFSNYLRQENYEEWKEHPSDELKRLQDERLKAKHSRDNLISKLGNELKIPTEEIPFGSKEFYEFVKEKIYKGIPRKEFESKGYKIKINEKAVSIADSVFMAMEEHRKIKSQINAFSISASINTFPKHLLNQLADFLGKVGDKLTKSFLEISPLKFIDKIEIDYDNQSVLALSLKLVLKNKSFCNPNQILSEANLDLLALMFFLAFIQESAERGQSKFLILDDVLQSIDSTIRVSFLNFLLKNFSDWQYLITVHDRLWHRQLIELMYLHGHQHSTISIVDWTFENGPKITDASNSIEDSLIHAIENCDLISICSNSGLLLENMCDGLSKSLNTSIHRKKDDKYSLGDLWPGISKLLKKTELKDKIETVEKWLHLRNLIGAHYNEWALALSLEESKNFGLSVKELFNSIKCTKCSNWLINSSDLIFYSCKCGKIIINKK
ncbi:MAG: AAA family ATPase [Bacteroidales bacterium]|nr:AAA family ATPase [Bacteroidales bacterium]